MRTLLTFLSAGVLAGCSLVNAFDEVKSEVEGGSGDDGSGGASGGGGSGDGGDETGGKDAAGGKGGASTGGVGATGGAPADGGNGGGGASAGGSSAGGVTGSGGAGGGAGGGGAGGGVPFNPDQDVGVVVAYRRAEKDLVVIDMDTAKIVSNEPMAAVPGIVNDGVTNNWYIFEQGKTPADGVTLHVRQLDPVTGVWKELGVATGLPNPRPFYGIGLLTKRLAYISFTAGTEYLTLLDVGNPTAIKVVGSPNRPLPPGTKQVLTATPQSAAVVGGTLNLYVQETTCTNVNVDGGTINSCDVRVHQFNVSPTDVTPSATPPTVVGSTFPGAPLGVAQDLSAPRAEVVVQPVLADPDTLPPDCIADEAGRTLTASVVKRSPSDLSPRGTAATFGFASDRVPSGGMVFDSCTNVVVLGTVNDDQGIHVVPLDPGGTASHLCVGAGTGFVFEPYKRVILRTGQFGDVEAYRLQGTATAPVVVAAPNAVPKNMVVSTMAARATAPCN